MVDYHPVTYNLNKKDEFIVHLPHKQVNFQWDQNGLYIYKLPEKPEPGTKIEAQFINTLEENKKFYMQHQFKCAKQARELFHSLGTLPIDQWYEGHNSNEYNQEQSSYHWRYQHHWENVWARYIFLERETTHCKPVPVIKDYIEIPWELIAAQHSITLCLDGMKVNGILFLTTISKNILYCTAQYVEKQTQGIYGNCLGQVFWVYNVGGFRITNAWCDNEFCPLMDPLANEFQVKMNYANPQEHVPEAECNNQVIKERVRATYHCLPFSRLQCIMIKILVIDSAKKLNFFPSKHESPSITALEWFYINAILTTASIANMHLAPMSNLTTNQIHQIQLPLALSIAFTFDTVIMSKEAMICCICKPIRWLYAIASCPSQSLAPAIIKQVDLIAKMDGMPKGLKITNHTGQVLYDSAWIAGVEYDQDELKIKIMKRKKMKMMTVAIVWWWIWSTRQSWIARQ